MDSIPDSYLIKVETMAPTTTRTAKNTREAYPPTKIPASFKFESKSD